MLSHNKRMRTEFMSVCVLGSLFDVWKTLSKNGRINHISNTYIDPKNFVLCCDFT